MSHVIRQSVLIPLLACTVACGADRTRPMNASLGAFTEELRIGSAEGTGPSSFAQIAAIEVDPSGRIYVLERQSQEIRVFDAHGVHMRTIGRAGAGPGELQQAIGFAWDPHGRLWVMDQQNARYTVFDTAGHLLFTRPRRITGWFTWRWQGGLDSAGRVYEWNHTASDPPAEMLLRYDSAITTADTFPLPSYRPEMFTYVRGKTMAMAATVAFTPTLHWTTDPRGYLWFGVSAYYRIYQRTLPGDTVHVFERAYDPLPVTTAERDSAVASYEWFTKQGGEIDPSRIPDRKPAFESFIVDDEGNLWVAPVVPSDQRGGALDLFDPSGQYRGRVMTLERFSPGAPFLIRRSRLYGVVMDADGVPYVIRARPPTAPIGS